MSGFELDKNGPKFFGRIKTREAEKYKREYQGEAYLSFIETNDKSKIVKTVPYLFMSIRQSNGTE